MRRPRFRYRGSSLVFLLPLLLTVFGFVPGTQSSSEEVRRAASSAPEVGEILSRPTVETSAEYDPVSDFWRVILREEASQTAVAEVTVVDDTQEVEDAEVYPVADTLTYPSTSEADAIKLALASPEVREELAKHGPYTSDAE